MQYRAKPVQVQAYEIAEVCHLVQTGKRRILLVLVGQPKRMPFTDDILSVFSPKRGDFLVIQENGDRIILTHQAFHDRYQEANALY